MPYVLTVVLISVNMDDRLQQDEQTDGRVLRGVVETSIMHRMLRCGPARRR